MKLAQSQVKYDRIKHEYRLGAVKLCGITEMIKRQLFPDEYVGISQSVLERAAERGSAIHDACEMADKFDEQTSDIPQVQAYIDMREAYGLIHEDSEYIVSDNEYFASPIDKVYRVDDSTFILADIKTTSKFMRESVRWQLSIYAYLFELNNPKAKIERLLGIWLPQARYGKPSIFEVERIDSAIVADLMRCEIEGKQFVNPFALTETNTGIPQRILDMTNEICETVRLAELYETKRKTLIAEVKDAMEQFDVYGWKTDAFNFIRKHDSERKTFDLDAFKKAYPDLPYDDFMKTSTVKGSVTLKIYDNQ